MTDWVFFDIGNVLFDDQGQSCQAYRESWAAIAAAQPGLTLERFFAEREDLARAGESWIMATLLKRHLGPEAAARLLAELPVRLAAEYDRWHLPAPGLLEVLDDLAADFQLAVVANQPVECAASLRRRGLTERFAVVGISDAEGLHKPDPEFYRWALRQTGADPGRTVMVGDRLDNDVAPAQAVGLRGVLVDWAAGARSWRPEDPFAAAFAASCQREPTFGRRREDVRPDAVVPDLRAVPAAVRALRANRP